MADIATEIPIATTTLGSATASYTFTSIPSTYTDFVLVVAGLTTNPSGQMVLRCGNTSIDTATNYSSTILYGDGTSAGSTRTTSATSIEFDTFGTNANNDSVVGIANFQNYANTTTYKTAITRFSHPSRGVVSTTGLWRSTSAINTIQVLTSNGTNLTSGLTLTLYGIL